MIEQGKNKNKLKSLSKAMKVLETLVYSEGPIRLSELSAQLSFSKSTLHRILSTLKVENFVTQDIETKKYMVGERFKLLGLYVFHEQSLLKIATPHLESLTNKAGETSNLVILAPNQREVVYVKQVASDATVKGFSFIGSRAPAHATGVGKVLLASKDWEGIRDVIDGNDLKALTDKTITDLSRLKEELKEVSEKGFAIDREECEKGAACIAAPVRNNRGETEAAISISGPAGRILDKGLSEMIDITKKEARRFSEKLGFNNGN